MIYVLEARAIAEIFVQRPSSVVTAPLTNLVANGQVTFPNDVIKEVKRHYEDDHCYTWACAVRGSRIDGAVPWDLQQDVLDDYPDLIDQLANHLNEPAAPSVLAQARRFQGDASSTPATVVTEDFGGVKPGGRLTLAECCDRDGIRWIRTDEFLSETSL